MVKVPKENFHIMITGGGSLIPIYKNGIQKLPFSTINDYTIDELDFPTPQDIVGIPSEKLNKIFHRLSIAYGLSHGSMNLFAVSTNALGDANHVPKSPVCIRALVPNLLSKMKSTVSNICESLVSALIAYEQVNNPQLFKNRLL